ncbi:MAG: exosortase/archaeosortase family protein [Erythrobacter sp.]
MLHCERPIPRELARFIVIAGLAVWLAPACLSLVQQTWRSEAGSLAPLLLAMGGWTLVVCRRRHADLAVRPGLLGPAAAFACLLPVYVFASAIDMVALLAITAWAGGVLIFFILNGAALTRACAFPLAFLGLVVPLPYSLSVPANALLRENMAQASSSLARFLSMETAVDQNALFIDQYQLNLDTACAGLSSTMSLVAIGLLFAFWVREEGRAHYVWVVLLAVPIALAANILRIVALLAGVRLIGPGILGTFVHPLSGMLSFVFALSLFVLALRARALAAALAER